MIPRSWNDFGPFVDSVAGDGSGDGRGEGILVSSEFRWVEVECFNFLNDFPSCLSVLPSAFRFINGAMFEMFEMFLKILLLLL